MSATKYILPETASFPANVLHHEEIPNSSPENLPNFMNHLVSDTEEGNKTFNSKEATSQPGRLDFVEATRKEIGAHENDKYCNLVIIRN